MKTSDLTGPALNWAVEIAEEMTVSQREFQPSANWAQGGPIIEREGIALDLHGDHWTALIWWDDEKSAAEITTHGPTPLIAAMRCYVASRLGEEVDIPEELK